MPNDLLGNSGVVIKIDETKIGQRKYNVDYSWPVGFWCHWTQQSSHICCFSKKLYCKYIDYNHSTISSSTTIYSDYCWKGSKSLNDFNYVHSIMSDCESF